MTTAIPGMEINDLAADNTARQVMLLALLARAGLLVGAGVLLPLHLLRPELNPAI